MTWLLYCGDRFDDGLFAFFGLRCASLLELLCNGRASFDCFTIEVFADLGLLKLTSLELIFNVYPPPGLLPLCCLMVTF